MRSVAAVVALVACVHTGAWALLQGQAIAPNFDGQLASVSYAPYGPGPRPAGTEAADEAKIRSDMKLLAPYTRAIRTYTSTNGVEAVTPIAAEFGLRVMAGAWINLDEGRDESANDYKDKKDREAQNTREVRSVIDLSRRYSNVSGIVVGNETILRAEKNVPSDMPEEKRQEEVNRQINGLISVIQQVKRANVRAPVTTGETWDIWLKHPELASHVDFIAAHILPYWEGKVSEKQVVDQTVSIYQRLRQAFPGKRIVIAEFGWPSAGYNNQAANPGRLEQAEVLRKFVARADAIGIDYNIVEAIDQPWKTVEGSVGPYWGLFDADRQPKFSWTGPISNADHWKLAGIAVLVGLLLSLPILGLTRATTGQAVLLAVSANLVGAWLATVFAYWKGHYFVPGAAFALFLGLTLLVPLVAIALARMQEIAAVVFGRAPLRLIASPPLAPDVVLPKVSIHIPAYREHPEMLKQTLDAVARLEYPNFECVVVINNTPDPAYWEPIEAHCAELGARFKFVNAQNVAGFKAGALRLALTHAASDAEVIGIIDADYVVQPDWLKDLVPLFADPKVGLIQAPQDHRDGHRSVMHEAMNGEYAGFFDIGMVQRNEFNAIITHGTMCLIRRLALDAAGGWSSDTICEDTDLGLTLLELGWVAHYTNRRYGHGLLPDTFEAYKKQRNRWAYGGLQIVKKHWRRFLPGASLLNRDQKREFTLGWLNWLGAESLGVAVAILNILWAPVVTFVHVAVPDTVLTIPIMAAFAVSLLHFVALYRSRVKIPVSQLLRVVFAAMAVQWTVAHAVAQALIKDHLPFVVTAKGGGGRRGREFQALWEAILAGLLLASAIMLVLTNEGVIRLSPIDVFGFKLLPTNVLGIREINIFAAALIVQSLPFLSAVVIAVFEGSRLNDFAYWRSVEGRFAPALPPQPVTIEAQATQLPADNRIEAPLAE